MSKNKKLNPLQIRLDKNNPRFALFEYDNEADIMNHLIKYENIQSLAVEIIKHGYVTLGERIIVLETNNHKYTVLEGNRRIAAIKMIFEKKELFETKYQKQIESFNSNNFKVDCDIINEEERSEAEYKISAKHIEGIKQWTPTNKRVYYDKLFTEYKSKNLSTEDAIEKVSKLTPETKTKIRKAIVQYRFIKSIYYETRKVHHDLENIARLDSDVLISRVKPRLVEELSLNESADLYMKCTKGKEKIYGKILLKLGEATWINKTLDTRTLNTKKMWKPVLDKDKVIPGLEELIQQYKTDYNWAENDVPLVNEAEKEGKSKNNPTSSKQAKSDSSSVPKKDTKPSIHILKENVEINKNNYDLMENIRLTEQNRILPKSSPEYKNISFGSENSDFIIEKTKISQVTKNGKYKIKVTYGNQHEEFHVNLLVIKKIETTKKITFFPPEWYLEAKEQLNIKGAPYNKIICVLNDLEESNNVNEIKDGYIVTAFLIRTLIEYSTNAYIDKYIEKPGSSLPANVKTVSENLRQKNKIKKEEGKVINPNYLEELNGNIHGYTANINSFTVTSLCSNYGVYLSSIFEALSEDD